MSNLINMLSSREAVFMQIAKRAGLERYFTGIDNDNSHPIGALLLPEKRFSYDEMQKVIDRLEYLVVKHQGQTDLVHFFIVCANPAGSDGDTEESKRTDATNLHMETMQLVHHAALQTANTEPGIAFVHFIGFSGVKESPRSILIPSIKHLLHEPRDIVYNIFGRATGCRVCANELRPVFLSMCAAWHYPETGSDSVRWSLECSFKEPAISCFRKHFTNACADHILQCIQAAAVLEDVVFASFSFCGNVILSIRSQTVDFHVVLVPEGRNTKSNVTIGNLPPLANYLYAHSSGLPAHGTVGVLAIGTSTAEYMDPHDLEGSATYIRDWVHQLTGATATLQPTSVTLCIVTNTNFSIFRFPLQLYENYIASQNGILGSLVAKPPSGKRLGGSSVAAEIGKLQSLYGHRRRSLSVYIAPALLLSSPDFQRYIVSSGLSFVATDDNGNPVKNPSIRKRKKTYRDDEDIIRQDTNERADKDQESGTSALGEMQIKSTPNPLVRVIFDKRGNIDFDDERNNYRLGRFVYRVPVLAKIERLGASIEQPEKLRFLFCEMVKNALWQVVGDGRWASVVSFIQTGPLCPGSTWQLQISLMEPRNSTPWTFILLIDPGSPLPQNNYNLPPVPLPGLVNSAPPTEIVFVNTGDFRWGGGNVRGATIPSLGIRVQAVVEVFCALAESMSPVYMHPPELHRRRTGLHLLYASCNVDDGGSYGRPWEFGPMGFLDVQPIGYQEPGGDFMCLLTKKQLWAEGATAPRWTCNRGLHSAWFRSITYANAAITKIRTGTATGIFEAGCKREEARHKRSFKKTDVDRISRIQRPESVKCSACSAENRVPEYARVVRVSQELVWICADCWSNHMSVVKAAEFLWVPP